MKARSESGRAALAPESDAKRKSSLADQAYAAIKRRIMTLEFRPGQYINESEVCHLLKIGRSPVHQAMHRLALEGLVEIVPRKGVFVRSDSLNEILELMEARWVIESHCAGLAAERAAPRDIEAMERLLQGGRKYLSAQAMEQFMQVDRAFHAAIAQAAGNSVLRDTLNLLHERLGRIWLFRVWQREDFESTQAEHEAIFAAMKRGDKERAVAATHEHITSLRRRIVESKT